MDTLTVTETPTDSCLSKLCLRIVFFRCRVVLDKNKEGSKYCSITKADVLGHFFVFDILKDQLDDLKQDTKCEMFEPFQIAD